MLGSSISGINNRLIDNKQNLFGSQSKSLTLLLRAITLNSVFACSYFQFSVTRLFAVYYDANRSAKKSVLRKAFSFVMHMHITV